MESNIKNITPVEFAEKHLFIKTEEGDVRPSKYQIELLKEIENLNEYEIMSYFRHTRKSWRSHI